MNKSGTFANLNISVLNVITWHLDIWSSTVSKMKYQMTENYSLNMSLIDYGSYRLFIFTLKTSVLIKFYTAYWSKVNNEAVKCLPVSIYHKMHHPSKFGEDRTNNEIIKPSNIQYFAVIIFWTQGSIFYVGFKILYDSSIKISNDTSSLYTCFIKTLGLSLLRDSMHICICLIFRTLICQNRWVWRNIRTKWQDEK